MENLIFQLYDQEIIIKENKSYLEKSMKIVNHHRDADKDGEIKNLKEIIKTREENFAFKEKEFMNKINELKNRLSKLEENQKTSRNFRIINDLRQDYISDRVIFNFISRTLEVKLLKKVI
jgi:predicted AlkP superfamily phosphohydrolase/phosphomutase